MAHFRIYAIVYSEPDTAVLFMAALNDAGSPTKGTGTALMPLPPASYWVFLFAGRGEL